MNICLSYQPSLASVRQLLASCDLPTSDLTSAHLQHFIGCYDTTVSDDALLGVIGLECFEPFGLLRSLAVTRQARRTGCANALVTRLESYARELNIEGLYLLTTTAERYFRQHGYQVIERQSAPVAIKQSEEFSSLCPDDAELMVKALSIT